MSKTNQLSQTKNDSIKAKRKGKQTDLLWSDCDLDAYYNALVKLLLQSKEGPRNPFWDGASRITLKEALQKYAVESVHDIEKLSAFFESASDQEFEDFFKETEAAPYTSSRSCISLAIRMLLLSYIADFLQAYSSLFPIITQISGGQAVGSISRTASEKNPSHPNYPQEKES